MTTDVARWSWTQLVEYLQKNHGIGWDDSSMPYYKWRARESIKIKNLCTSRRVDIPTVVVCAEYCRAHNKNVESVAGLLFHLQDAKGWQKGRTSTDLEVEIQQAIERERALADGESEDWISQLLRAEPSKQQEVLAEWQSTRR